MRAAEKKWGRERNLFQVSNHALFIFSALLIIFLKQFNTFNTRLAFELCLLKVKRQQRAKGSYKVGSHRNDHD